ncbi:MAG: hypothetical protein WC295_02790 [Methanoregula sp.]|jgi:hypothetical protein
MADFVQSTNVKSAVRGLASPIGNVSTFNTIVQSVITTNPFGCVAYMTAGVNHNPVEKTKETYTAWFVYEDEAANSVGYTVERFNTIAGFNTGVGLVMANTAMATAHNGTTIHDPEEDGFSATLKCHDPNGEIYSVTFTRGQIGVSSYSDDAILATVETWADTVTELA